MIRVETLVLVVVAWLVATANGRLVDAPSAQGRDGRDPANWLFVAACFMALVALHFVLLAPVRQSLDGAAAAHRSS